jgi:hypothetical protein
MKTTMLLRCEGLEPPLSQLGSKMRRTQTEHIWSAFAVECVAKLM